MPTIDLGRVKGQDGQAATIAVGTVTTGAAGSSASVTNSGTQNAAVFDFVIPKGDNGFGAITDDDISGREYIVGAEDEELYMVDNQATPQTKRILTATLESTWTEEE
ncbi:MAG: hypothetical protein IJV04_00730 [Lachnospiraceae bacterium]|nr:hypothetical protein [Lachnospiraceae bacterium]